MRTVIAIVALVAYHPAAQAQDLSCPKPNVDLGEVKSGRDQVQSFELKHSGSSGTLTFGEVATACGCTKPTLGAKSLQPGESTQLGVSLNTLTQSEGRHKWSVRVKYYSGELAAPGELELELQANIIREISVNPAIVAMSITAEAKQILTVQDRRAKPLTISKATCGNAAISCMVGTSRTNDKAITAQDVVISIAASLKVGTHDETITLETDDATCPTLTVPIKIHKRNPADVQAIPAEATVRFTRNKTEASTLVQLRHNGKVLQVKSVECGTPGITTKFSEDAAAVSAIRVSVDMRKAGANGTAELIVNFTDETLTKLVIPLTWYEP